MIILITGQPGAGKTLYGLNYVKEWSEREKRPVYYNGINDLKLPWIQIDQGEDWHKCPKGSIVVVDECQRVFRPRGTGTKVPEHVALLETHRHQGIDLVLITQHPMLADTNVRRLVGRHFHVVRNFGLKKSTVHEWAEVKEGCDKSRTDSIRHDFLYPKESFDWYKSAEVHTHKARIPARLFILALLPILLGGLIWIAYSWWNTSRQPTVQDRTTGPLTTTESARIVKPQPISYEEAYIPRYAAFPHTAPVYDSLTAPKQAPTPAGCIASKNRCVCYTEQATRLFIDETTCRRMASEGFFKDWNNPVGQENMETRLTDRKEQQEPVLDGPKQVTIASGLGTALPVTTLSR